VLSIPLVGDTGCFFSGINEMSPKKVRYDHRLNMTFSMAINDVPQNVGLANYNKISGR
jgi:hypothetical protein